MKTIESKDRKSASLRGSVPRGVLRKSLIAAAAMSALFGLSPGANAAQVTTTMAVSLTISAGCSVATTSLSFGTASILTSTIDQTSSIYVTCTDATAYQLGIDAGLHSSGAQRRMQNGSNSADFVSYNLYSDAGRATAWGNTQNTDTLVGTGNGSVQTISVYGRVPSQTSEDAGSYSDIVTVTVYF